MDPPRIVINIFATVDYNYKGESCKQKVLNETEHSQLLSSSVHSAIVDSGEPAFFV